MDTQQAPVSDAYIRGRQTGKLSLSPGLCPYPDGTPEANDWTRGWQSANDEAFSAASARLKREQERPQWQRDLATGARDPHYGRAA